MAFGTELRARRERLRITQAQLAQMLGVDHSCVSHWETGKHTPHSVIRERIDDLLAPREQKAPMTYPVDVMELPLELRLRVLRVWRDLSQRELAKQVFVDTSTVSGWEVGRQRPCEAAAGKLAEALDVPPEVVTWP